MESIKDKDYNHAKKVWNTLKIKDLGEYQVLYVPSVTLLLSDVFETFHKTGFKENKLDPIYFVSTPGLSLEACLKLSKSKIRIINRFRYVINV